jgi:hypothetical protein
MPITPPVVYEQTPSTPSTPSTPLPPTSAAFVRGVYDALRNAGSKSPQQDCDKLINELEKEHPRFMDLEAINAENLVKIMRLNAGLDGTPINCIPILKLRLNLELARMEGLTDYEVKETAAQIEKLCNFTMKASDPVTPSMTYLKNMLVEQFSGGCKYMPQDTPPPDEKVTPPDEKVTPPQYTPSQDTSSDAMHIPLDTSDSISPDPVQLPDLPMPSIEHFKSLNTALVQKTRKLTKHIEEQHSILASIKLQCKPLARDLHAANEQNKILTKNNRLMVANAMDIQTYQKEQAEKHRKLEEKLVSTNKAMKLMNDSFKKNLSTCDRLIAENEDLKIVIEARDEELDDYNKRIKQSVKNERRKHQDIITNLKNEHMELMANIQSGYQTAVDKNTELERVITKLKKAQTPRPQGDSNKKDSVSPAEITRLRLGIREMQAANVQLHSQLKKVKKSEANLATRMKKAHDKHRLMDTEETRRKQILANTTAELKSTKATLKTATAELATTKSELTAATAERKKMLTKINTLKIDNGGFYRREGCNERKIKALTAQIAKLESPTLLDNKCAASLNVMELPYPVQSSCASESKTVASNTTDKPSTSNISDKPSTSNTTDKYSPTPLPHQQLTPLPLLQPLDQQVLAQVNIICADVRNNYDNTALYSYASLQHFTNLGPSQIDKMWWRYYADSLKQLSAINYNGISIATGTGGVRNLRFIEMLLIQLLPFPTTSAGSLIDQIYDSLSVVYMKGGRIGTACMLQNFKDLVPTTFKNASNDAKSSVYNYVVSQLQLLDHGEFEAFFTNSFMTKQLTGSYIWACDWTLLIGSP